MVGRKNGSGLSKKGDFFVNGVAFWGGIWFNKCFEGFFVKWAAVLL